MITTETLLNIIAGGATMSINQLCAFLDEAKVQYTSIEEYSGCSGVSGPFYYRDYLLSGAIPVACKRLATKLDSLR
jgi:hypothetical protein